MGEPALVAGWIVLLLCVGAVNWVRFRAFRRAHRDRYELAGREGPDPMGYVRQRPPFAKKSSVLTWVALLSRFDDPEVERLRAAYARTQWLTMGVALSGPAIMLAAMLWAEGR